MLTLPNERGRFGMFGGKFVPETLMRPLADIEQQLYEAMADPSFHAEYMHHLYEYSGRPTALTFAKNLTERLGGAKMYFKREDLNHTGAHKINNAIGQADQSKGRRALISLPPFVQAQQLNQSSRLQMDRQQR